MKKKTILLTPPKKKYECDVISEGGFRVFFSNQGNKIHEHPVLKLNDKRAKIKCAIPGCNIETKRMDGICTEHAKNKELVKKYAKHHNADWFSALLKENQDNTFATDHIPRHLDIIDWLIDWANKDKKKMERLDMFILNLANDISKGVPDASLLQNALVSNQDKVSSYLKTYQEYVNLTFPKDDFGNQVINLNFKSETITVPVRVIAILLATALFCEEVNRGDSFYRKETNRGESKRAGGLMPIPYYLLLRHTTATKNQAHLCIRS
jgi:hypothetical protein